jgi:hypothetical protein
MRATLLCDELPVEIGLLELPVEFGPLELDVGEVVIVTVMPEVDDGELGLRHEESLDPETVSNSETPPCLPAESVTKYKTLFPASTSTTKVEVSLFE